MGLPLPYEFDGRVLDELFEEQKAQGTESGLARRKLKKLLEA
jgi:hypothetical protein